MTTLRTRLAGLAALAGLLLVLVGTPAVLIAIGATPFPDGIPTWQEAWATLTGVDDGTVMLTLFRLAAWGAWAYLALGVLLELAWRARGIRAPRIRGLGLSQSTAHALVSAAFLAFTALPSLAAPATAATPAVSVSATLTEPVHTTSAAAAVIGGDDANRATAVMVEDAPATVVHTVRPGETLWGIAETYLGDGARFLEIADANYARPQPDGRTLTTTHRIHPGWQLLIPTTPDETNADVTPATGVSDYTVAPGDTLWDIAADELDDPMRYGEIYTASTDITQPGGHHLSDPDEISPGWTLHIPTGEVATPDPVDVTPPAVETPVAVPAEPPATPADDSEQAAMAPHDGAPTQAPAPATVADATVAEANAVDADSSEAGDGAVEDVAGWPVRTTTGVGSLLAAGLVALLTTRRAMQARHRRPGMVLPVPTGPAGATETQLRGTADRFSVSAVDTALRTLARSRAEHAQPLPVLRYARLSAGQLDLHLAEPAHLPEPWSGTADATVWTLRVEDADLLDPATAAQTPAPYPALVTLGHDCDGAHVFLDLEQVGSLAVVGDEDRARDILAALAVELATSAWADDLQVTTVTAFPGLEDALRTGRIRYVPSAGRVFDELTARAENDRAALAEAGAPDLAHARTSDAAPDTWYPEIVLLATPLTDRQRNQLTALLDGLPRVAVAALTTGPGTGDWELTLTGEDGAVLAPLGLRLRPQRLDPTAYRHILDLLSLTATDPTEPYPTGPHAPGHHDDLPAPGTDVLGSEGRAPDLAADAGRQDGAGLPEEGRQDLAARPAAHEQGRGVLPDQNGQGHGRPHEDGGQDDHAPGGSGTPAPGGPLPNVLPERDGQAHDVLPGQTRQKDVEDPAPALRGAPADDQAGECEAPSVDVLPPFIRLLGRVVVEGTQGSIDLSREAFSTEFVAFLVLNPRVSATALEEALWPGERIHPNTRRTNTSRVRRWLGMAPNRKAWLADYQDRTGFVLDQAVRSDWDVWCELLPDGPLPAPTPRLEEALELVRGRPFENATPKSYAWAEPIRARMVAQIADAACELARRRAHARDWRGAEEAAISGLAIDPSLERLWRVRILAAHATRSEHAGQEAIERMLTIAGQLGGDLEAETSALLAGIQEDTDPDILLAVAL